MCTRSRRSSLGPASIKIVEALTPRPERSELFTAGGVTHGESLMDSRSMFLCRLGFPSGRRSGQSWCLVLGHFRDVSLCIILTRAAERVPSRFRGALVISPLVSRKSEALNASVDIMANTSTAATQRD